MSWGMNAIERNFNKIPCNNGHVGEWATIGSKPYGVCKSCRKSIKRKSRYGITQDEYDRLLAEQRGCCAICWSDNSGEELAVDHDHMTREIRGLLCRQCNTLVGIVETGHIKLAIQYLKKYGKEV